MKNKSVTNMCLMCCVVVSASLGVRIYLVSIKTVV